MANYSSIILSDSPQAYYLLNETSGTTAADDSGNANNGTYAGAGVFYSQTGALAEGDTAVGFDGIQGNMACPAGVNLHTYSSGMSVEFWVNLPNLTQSSVPSFVASDNVTSTHNGIDIAVDATATHITFKLGNGTTTATITGAFTFAANTWYYIVATWNGSTCTLYLNGTSLGTASLSGSIGTAANNLTLGNNPTTGTFFNGVFDDFAVYNYALTQTQITAHYNAGTTVYVSTTSLATYGYVQLLIQDVYYHNIRQESIKIDRTANDPISTFNVILQDDPSQITISELQEVIFIDAGQITNPTHNLLQNPLISPYATNYTQTKPSGGTFTNVAPGVLMQNTNIASDMYLSQTTQNGLVIAGQQYCLSCTVATGTLTNCSAFMQMSFLDLTGVSLGTQTTTIGSGLSATRYSLQGPAPTGTVNIVVSFGISESNATNSGNATFTSIQLEPMSFTSGYAALSYPTAFCATGQSNCTVLPDNTTIRQYRLFGGLVTKATAGKYMGNNRQWNITVSSYAWLLQKQVLNNTWSNKTDSSIISDIVTSYFPKVFSTAQVATGSTLDAFAYTYNGTARDAFDALCQNSGFFFFVDAYRVIWYQPPGYTQLGFSLSDQPDFVTSFPYYDYSLDLDATQLGNACLVTGATNISAIEYDAQSIGYYNQVTNGQGTFWRTVNDTTITTTNAARQRAVGEISQYNYARKIAHLTTNEMMIPGQTVLFTSNTDNIYQAPYLIQKASLILKGFQSHQIPYYEHQCDIGSWNPDLVTIVVKLHRKQQVSTQSIGTPVIGLMVTESTTFTDALTVQAVAVNNSVYGTGVYGVTTWQATAPSLPSTTYSVGTWNDATKGYA